MVKFWKALADHYKTYPANKVAFEVYNEPHVTAVAPMCSYRIGGCFRQGRCIQAFDRHAGAFRDRWRHGVEQPQRPSTRDPISLRSSRVQFPFLRSLHLHPPARCELVDSPPARKVMISPASSPERRGPALIASATSQSVKDALTWMATIASTPIPSTDGWVRPQWATRNRYSRRGRIRSYKPVSPQGLRIAWIHAMCARHSRRTVSAGPCGNMMKALAWPPIPRATGTIPSWTTRSVWHWDHQLYRFCIEFELCASGKPGFAVFLPLNVVEKVYSLSHTVFSFPSKNPKTPCLVNTLFNKRE